MTSTQLLYNTTELQNKLELKLAPAVAKTKISASVSKAFNSANDGIFEGARNSSLMSIAGTMRARGMGHTAILNALLAMNREQVQPPLSDSEVERIANSVMRYTPSTDATELRRSLNDVGNALRLVSLFGEVLRYVPEWGSWIHWDGVRWQRDYHGVKIMEFAQLVVKAIYNEAQSVSDAALATEIMKHASRSHHASRITAMLELACKDAKVVLPAAHLDANPMRLGVENGVVDLRTGKLTQNKLEYYITKFSRVQYDKTAACPTFLAFLGRIFEGKAETIAYVRRLIGYCLTGRTDAQVLFFFYGTGANGKSTLLSVIEFLLGADLSKQTPPETLMAQSQGTKPSNDLARLQGVRVVLSNEVEDGSFLAEATVKQMTGGDTITARFLYREYFEFKPEFKIIVAGNHKPVIRGTDYGIWRRIHLVGFPVTIPTAERDPALSSKLEAEMPGIMNWAITGCKDWQKKGLTPPQAITAAVEDYREEMDILGHWIANSCTTGDELASRAADLYENYKNWAVWCGFKPMTITAFGRRLSERGLTKGRDGRGVVYKGLKLNSSIG